MADTRVGSLSANSELVNLILKTQRRILGLQAQVTSEKVSQVYSGLPRDAQRLVNLETLNQALGQFVKNNDTMSLRVDVASDAVASAQDVIDQFRDALTNYSVGGRKDETAVENIQDWAFRSLQSMQSLLNTQADGRYVFSGARVLTPPADLGLTTLEDFQATYDGATVTYPTTRDAHLADFSIDDDGAGDTTWLVFARDAGGTGVSRITSTTAQFSNIAVGTKITVSGTASNDGTYTVSSVGGGGTTIDIVTEMLTDEVAVPITVTYDDPTDRDNDLLLSATATFNRAASTINHGGALNDIAVGEAFTVSGSADNDGTYTVASNTGGIITIVRKFLTDEGAAAAEVDGTISASSYYNGDEVDLTHRVDKDRTFTFNLNGVDPAFEKAIRAMGLIAQGAFGAEGGLDQNPARINQALYLLSSSLERVVIGTPPFGTELTSNLAYVEQTLGFNAVLLSDTNNAHDRFIGFLEESIANIENVDPTETITKLLDDTRALEASYQALARIRELSLVNFLPV